MKKCCMLLILATNFLIMACSGRYEDPCDVNHVVINGECIPDYIFPSNITFQNGDKYYHQKHGVIIYKDGLWIDEHQHIIEDLEIKTYQ